MSSRTNGVIIGGSRKMLYHPHVVQQVDRCVGGGGSLVIVTVPANKTPITMPALADGYRIGALRVTGVISLFTRQDAFEPQYLRLAEQADAMLLISDDPLRCISILPATPLWSTMVERHEQGAPLIAYGASGAILGAHVLSEPTQHLVDVARMLHLPPGLATVANVIINAEGYRPVQLRVLARAIAQNPSHFGLALDEYSAVVVRNDGVEVFGDGQVYVFDGRGRAAITLDEEVDVQPVPWHGLQLHCLSSGNHFSLTRNPSWVRTAFAYELLLPRSGGRYTMN